MQSARSHPICAAPVTHCCPRNDFAEQYALQATGHSRCADDAYAANARQRCNLSADDSPQSINAAAHSVVTVRPGTHSLTPSGSASPSPRIWAEPPAGCLHLYCDGHSGSHIERPKGCVTVMKRPSESAPAERRPRGVPSPASAVWQPAAGAATSPPPSRTPAGEVTARRHGNSPLQGFNSTHPRCSSALDCGQAHVRDYQEPRPALCIQA